MVMRMKDLLEQPGISFIAVGAGHVPGQSGVCELLRCQGYTVQRLFEDHPDILPKRSWWRWLTNN